MSNPPLLVMFYLVGCHSRKSTTRTVKWRVKWKGKNAVQSVWKKWSRVEEPRGFIWYVEIRVSAILHGPARNSNQYCHFRLNTWLFPSFRSLSWSCRPRSTYIIYVKCQRMKKQAPRSTPEHLIYIFKKGTKGHGRPWRHVCGVSNVTAQ